MCFPFKIKYSVLGRAVETPACSTLSRLLRERAPLILHATTNKDNIASHAEQALSRMKVVQVDTIERHASLFGKAVKQPTSASADVSSKARTLYISQPLDLYDVATTLTRTLFVRCKLSDIFLVHSLLEAPLDTLRRRGTSVCVCVRQVGRDRYPVDMCQLICQINVCVFERVSACVCVFVCV